MHTSHRTSKPKLDRPAAIMWPSYHMEQSRQPKTTMISEKKLFHSFSINRPLRRFGLLLVMQALVSDAVSVLVFYKYRPLYEPCNFNHRCPLFKYYQFPY
jgi:hypothetical protein